MLQKHILVFVSLLFVWSCASPVPENTKENVVPKEEKWSATYQFSKEVIAFRLPLTLEVSPVLLNASALSQGEISALQSVRTEFFLQDKTFQVDHTKATSKELYLSSEFQFPTAGNWSFTIFIQTAKAKYEVKGTIEVGCFTDKKEGSPCCEDTHCNTGLLCIANQCSSQLQAIDAKCVKNEHCESKICENGLCSQPNCTNGIQDGLETDVDCGGIHCGTCKVGKQCKLESDCPSQMGCFANKCDFSSGSLLGKKDNDENITVQDLKINGLSRPMDLQFHPDLEDELWVVNGKNDSITRIGKASTTSPTTFHYLDQSQHFLEEVTSISFGEAAFGTCGDSRNTYGGQGAPNDFMGPVWWTSNVNDLNKSYTNLSAGHWDMLHKSPYCMGIAHIEEGKFFVFNGYNKTIDWYDFAKPHVPGGDDHSDGKALRLKEVSVSRVAGVPSNLFYDKQSKLLYVADTGNARILSVNPSNMLQSKALQTFQGDGPLHEAINVSVTVLVKQGLVRPSGLTVFQKEIYVADNGTGKIHVFLQDGSQVRVFDTKLGAGVLGGMTVGPDYNLYVTDIKNNKVYRIKNP